MAPILLSVIVALSIVLMLVRPRGISEVYWIGSGALLLVLLRLVPLKLAGSAIARGTDVYLFLIGMMLLSELAREQGVFDWLSSVVVRGANGSCVLLFTLVYAAGTFVTIFMSNDATAVVLTPAILTAVRKAKVPPLPYLFACALIANAASFVLPISNPANLVVFHGDMPPLKHWLLSFGVPSALSIVVTYLVMLWLFRKDLATKIEVKEEIKPLRIEGWLVLIGLVLMVAVLMLASYKGSELGLPTCIAALVITAVISLKARSNPLNLAKEISWSTIALVAGLFILVDAVESIGLLDLTTSALYWTQSLAPALGATVTSFSVGIGNNLVNNLPLGLIAGGTLQAANVHGLLANVVLIGVDLGPNLSVTGSLATILWLIALRKENINVSFWGFLKVGAVAMPIALLAATAGAILTTHQRPSLWRPPIACSNMSLGPNGALNGFVPSPNDAWHEEITWAQVDPASTKITTDPLDLGGSVLHPDFNSKTAGIPYTVVDSRDTPGTLIPVGQYADESDMTPYPVPANLPVEYDTGSCATDTHDRHAIMVDRNQCVAYELYQASHCTSQWTASASALWDFKTTEKRPVGFTSVDAAGLSVFEGLIRYDEIVAGSIDHAIRFTAKNTRDSPGGGYMTPPATHAAGTHATTDNIIGMRLRLRADFDIKKFSPTNQIILRAMKQYGLILADNGANMFIQGTPDPRWNDADLARLKKVPSSAFEVVRMQSAYDTRTLPKGAPPAIVSFTSSASSVVPGTKVTLTPKVRHASYSYIDKIGFIRGKITVTPTTTTTYILTSRNQYGTSTASTTVTVQTPNPK